MKIAQRKHQGEAKTSETEFGSSVSIATWENHLVSRYFCYFSVLLFKYDVSALFIFGSIEPNFVTTLGEFMLMSFLFLFSFHCQTRSQKSKVFPFLQILIK